MGRYSNISAICRYIVVLTAADMTLMLWLRNGLFFEVLCGTAISTRPVEVIAVAGSRVTFC